MAMKAIQPVSLELETRSALPASEAAYHLNRAQPSALTSMVTRHRHQSRVDNSETDTGLSCTFCRKKLVGQQIDNKSTADPILSTTFREVASQFPT